MKEKNVGMNMVFHVFKSIFKFPFSPTADASSRT